MAAQNDPDSFFNKVNVRHLFLDSPGSYSSGVMTQFAEAAGKEGSDLCIVSGAFFKDMA